MERLFYRVCWYAGGNRLGLAVVAGDVDSGIRVIGDEALTNSEG